MSVPAIEIDDLDYAYKSEWLWGKTQRLFDLSLTVQRGEAFGFLGHNGAGKTTTIKCILNLIKPMAGAIKIFGKDSRTIEARRQIGYLPEQPYFYDHLTVREIMEMYAGLAGVEKGNMKTYIKEALEMVRVIERADEPMRSLSKGLTQRVAMAQALVAKPQLLILDEPFSGLDPLGRKEFSDLLDGLKTDGTTIFMSSHILSDVEAVCDRASIMVNGRLKRVLNLNELPDLTHGHYELVVRNYSGVRDALVETSSSFRSQEKFLSLSFRDKTTAEIALQKALASDALVESYRFVHGGLEELFVKLMAEEES